MRMQASFDLENSIGCLLHVIDHLSGVLVVLFGEIEVDGRDAQIHGRSSWHAALFRSQGWQHKAEASHSGYARSHEIGTTKNLSDIPDGQGRSEIEKLFVMFPVCPRLLLTSLSAWAALRAVLLNFGANGVRKHAAGAARRQKVNTRMLSPVRKVLI